MRNMDMSYLSCKKTQTIKRLLICYAIGRTIKLRGKLTPISHEENNHLGKSCVTMIDLMVTFYEKTELSDVICEECSKSICKTSKANFGTKQSVLKSPMQLIIFLRIS